MPRKMTTHPKKKDSAIRHAPKSKARSENDLAQQANPAHLLMQAINAPTTLTPSDILTLQQTAGNRVVGHILDAMTAQTKNSLSRHLPVSARATSNRTGLPDQLKAGIEALSGMDLSDVQVHINSDKPAQVNALAYTQGNDIYLGPGTEKHLAHETWHVVQQRQGRVKPTLQAKGAAINDDGGLENEADVMGSRAHQVIQRRAPQCSLGCGCPACVNPSDVSGTRAVSQARLTVSANPNGTPPVIQRWKCPRCGLTGLKSNEAKCSVCGTARPQAPGALESATAAPAKRVGPAAAAVAAALPPPAAAPVKRAGPASASAAAAARAVAAAPTNTIRVQLQVMIRNKEETYSEVVDRFGPITQAEAIEALNALLSKVVVPKSILKEAVRDVGPRVVEKIKAGAIGQSVSTYFPSLGPPNRIDVENIRGKGNFCP